MLKPTKASVLHRDAEIRSQLKCWNSSWTYKKYWSKMHWLGHGILRYKYPTFFTHALDAQISVQEVSQAQDLQMLFTSALFSRAMLEMYRLEAQIRQQLVQVPLAVQEDAKWKLSNTRCFSVKSAYWALKNGPAIRSNLHRIWKLNILLGVFIGLVPLKSCKECKGDLNFFKLISNFNFINLVKEI